MDGEGQGLCRRKQEGEVYVVVQGKVERVAKAKVDGEGGGREKT